MHFKYQTFCCNNVIIMVQGGRPTESEVFKMYEDLFFAVKHYLLECGRNVSTAEMVATKLVNEAVKRNATEEDIKRLRDIFIAQEVIKMKKYVKIAIGVIMGCMVINGCMSNTTPKETKQHSKNSKSKQMKQH